MVKDQARIVARELEGCFCRHKSGEKCADWPGDRWDGALNLLVVAIGAISALGVAHRGGWCVGTALSLLSIPIHFTFRVHRNYAFFTVDKEKKRKKRKEKKKKKKKNNNNKNLYMERGETARIGT